MSGSGTGAAGGLRDPALESRSPSADPADRSRRVCIEVFGCQMNKLDSELLEEVLLESGFEMVEDPDRAGIILFNTCAVRQHAEDRVFSRIGRLKAAKRRRPDLLVGVLGCIPQHEGKELLRRFPHVDILAGPAEFLRLPGLIETARRGGGPVQALDIDADVKFNRRKNLGPASAQAYVSVMRGCDQSCSFCIVPSTRGREVSRPVAEIVDEVRALVDAGVKEVTLLGQTVNSYGKRLEVEGGPRSRIGLHHLLHALDRIPGLERLRFITSHPLFMGEDLIAAMADLRRVCGYLHLPVQSGSDAVLRRMRRGYTAGRYREIIARCRERIPDFAVATDIIVGFPGETDEDFLQTRRLQEEIRFQGAFVFKYSVRPGTPAEDVPDDVPEGVKRERNAELLALQERISCEIHRAQVGSVEEVLVEGVSKNDPARLTGRNRRQQIVVFPGVAADGLTGKLVPVRIVDSTPLVLVGEKSEPGGG